jgi:hypothetical protein
MKRTHSSFLSSTADRIALSSAAQETKDQNDALNKEKCGQVKCLAKDFIEKQTNKSGDDSMSYWDTAKTRVLPRIVHVPRMPALIWTEDIATDASEVAPSPLTMKTLGTPSKYLKKSLLVNCNCANLLTFVSGNR